MKSKIRVVFLLVVVLIMSFITFSFVSSEQSVGGQASAQKDLQFEEREPIVGTRENITVVTGQGFQLTGSEKALMAFAPDGRLLYHENRYLGYLDVDPESTEKRTVLVSAFDKISPEECGTELHLSPDPACIRNIILQVNISTGEQEILYEWLVPEGGDQKVHDIDRVGPDQILIGDLGKDRVFIVNTTSNIIEWQWDIQSDYSPSDGGRWPRAWSHVNDVEMLKDGRIMVSLRNMDSVVFVHPDRGLLKEQSLGEQGNHTVLHRQHNPDYINEENGGPAVIVADSHNDRIVEYERKNENWHQTWVWSDAALDWPRDADRLPNGHTLIVDSNGNRLVEIDRNGEIVWEVTGKSFYDAERLGTGDESTRGPSARDVNLTSVNEETPNTGGLIVPIIPGEVRAAIKFVSPQWMSWESIFASIGLLGLLIFWAGLEMYWRWPKLEFRSPVLINRK